MITGPNAQGKTNLLEAVYFLSCGKSFRTRFDREMIGFEYSAADILADITSHDRDQTVNIQLLTGIAGVNLEGYEFGFAAGEGADYVFSANAFRRIVGVTPNEYTYKVRTGTDETNYNIFVRYGELEVTD